MKGSKFTDSQARYVLKWLDAGLSVLPRSISGIPSMVTCIPR